MWTKIKAISKALFVHWRYPIIITTISILSFSILVILSIFLTAKWMEPPKLLVSKKTVFLNSNGNVFAEEGLANDWMHLNDIPKPIIQTTLAVEDRNFYHHYGFDIKRIAAAALTNITSGDIHEGASTITQQLYRNAYSNQERTWKRKFKEAFYALRYEVHYSKGEILEAYLNSIYYGGGAYGIEKAADRFFGKSAHELSISEIAFLVGLPAAPTAYHPNYHFDRAKSRQELILKLLYKQKLLSKDEYNDATKVPLYVLESSAQPVSLTSGSYVKDAIKRELSDHLQMPFYLTEEGGLKIETTIDPTIQRITEEAVAKYIPVESQLQASVVVQNPITGAVLAVVGGRDYNTSPYNRIFSKRQAGSTFKPFLYYEALLSGYTPASLLKSEETVFQYDHGNSIYKPKNYGNHYANGNITMLQALALSDNIYAVKTYNYIGYESLVDIAKKLGIQSPLNNFPSLALGASPVTPLEMTNAYSIFANGGKEVKPYFIKKITDASGKVVYKHHFKSKRLLDYNATFVLNDMMKGMFNTNLNGYTRVTGASIANQLHRKYAGKSGSTTVDSWMIGYTPQQTTGVWVGYDKTKILTSATEQSYVKKIWAHIMEHSLENIEPTWYVTPDHVSVVKINPDTGERAGKNCPKSVSVAFIKGTEPTELCEGPEPEQKKEEKKSWLQRLF